MAIASDLLWTPKRKQTAVVVECDICKQTKNSVKTDMNLTSESVIVLTSAPGIADKQRFNENKF